MAPLDLLRSWFSQKPLFLQRFERFLGDHVPDWVPSDPLPHITRRDPEIRRGNLRFPLFPKVFRRAPLQRTGIRVVHSGARSAPLDLLGSEFSQKPLFSQRF